MPYNFVFFLTKKYQTYHNKNDGILLGADEGISDGMDDRLLLGLDDGKSQIRRKW